MFRAPDEPVGISRIHYPVQTLGPGDRAAVWFQGCSIGCSGCVSTDTWKPASEPTRTSHVLDHIVAASQGQLGGLTISGGEPFDQPEALHALLSALRSRDDFKGVDVLVYTGYYLSKISAVHPAIVKMIDAVVDGPFVEGQPPALPIAGSGNQGLHLLTDLGRVRFAPREKLRGGLQVAVSGGQVWFAGVPRRGEMDYIKNRMAERGVEIGAESWKM